MFLNTSRRVLSIREKKVEKTFGFEYIFVSVGREKNEKSGINQINTRRSGITLINTRLIFFQKKILISNTRFQIWYYSNTMVLLNFWYYSKIWY